MLTSQFFDWIEQLERIVLIGSCVFLFLSYVAARTHGLLAEVYRIIANDLRVWGGGGEVEDFGGGSQNIQGE